jgi:hypothetical protein
MTSEQILKLLQDVQNGGISPEQAVDLLKIAPFEISVSQKWITTGPFVRGPER